MTVPNRLSDMTDNEQKYAHFMEEMMEFFYDESLVWTDIGDDKIDWLATSTCDAHNLYLPDGSIPQWVAEAAARVIASHKTKPQSQE